MFRCDTTSDTGGWDSEGLGVFLRRVVGFGGLREESDLIWSGSLEELLCWRQVWNKLFSLTVLSFFPAFVALDFLEVTTANGAATVEVEGVSELVLGGVFAAGAVAVAAAADTVFAPVTGTVFTMVADAESEDKVEETAGFEVFSGFGTLSGFEVNRKIY